VPLTHALLLVVAGLGGGLAGSIAGLASIISYPALLSAGLAPVAANVTNTVALVFSGAGSTIGARPELRGRRPLLWRLTLAAAVGGLAGGALLLVTPQGAFTLAVPWLIGLASVAILLRPPARAIRERSTPGRPLTAAVVAIGVYGGYFGAAAGVLMLAALLAATGDTVARSSAVKNVALGVANGVAAVAFVCFGPVHWTAVVPLGLGFLVGGRLGPVLLRRAPAGPLRVVIALAGLGLAVHLGLDAYR
jgi:uncharacterized membrane protein YfcA